MPAISPDPRSVPVVNSPAPGAHPKSIRSVTTAPTGVEGEGFPIRRAFAGIPIEQLDPFIVMDHMGAVEYAPYEAKGTPWHPHRGFETVTYIIDGQFDHQDSHGGGGRIADGDTQWMTAGSGILHIETPPASLVESGGLFHGVQLWVNLPAKDKFIAPAYQAIEAASVVVFATADRGALVRLIAGDVAGFEGPGRTQTPIALAHVTIQPGAELELPWPDGFNALGYVMSGDALVGPNARPLAEGQLAVFGEGDTIVVRGADSPAGGPAEVLLLGGQPIGEPVVMHGPFVMNTEDEIRQAIEDFEAGQFGRIPEDGLQPYRR